MMDPVIELLRPSNIGPDESSCTSSVPDDPVEGDNNSPVTASEAANILAKYLSSYLQSQQVNFALSIEHNT